jgi:CDP-diacylglycerol--serine O-phosphatidyltransferase
VSEHGVSEEAPIDPGPARLGPKASEDEIPVARRFGGGLTLRAVLPNAITAAALCSGLTGIRFAISAASGQAGDWEKALLAIVFAGVLDGIDGRIARLLKAQSRFGAELDSLADSLSFGMAPALVLFLWSLQELPRFGWFASLAFAICCALRLARFNARIDEDEQPHKSAGFLTGVPAPVGAGLAFLPMYLWIATGEPLFREPWLVAVWLAANAFLMISNIATLSWKSIRPRRSIRLEAIALAGLVFAALLTEPWWTLAAICFLYLALMPIGIAKYAAVKRLRVGESEPPAPSSPEPDGATSAP